MHKFRENGDHYNGGREFFGYGFQAVDEPRLYMVRRWYRHGARRGKTEDHLFVDGAPVPDYESALAALRLPVQFTDEERAALRLIADEPWRDDRKEIDFLVLHGLGKKGAVEWGPPGYCKRTDVGRAALIAPSSE